MKFLQTVLLGFLFSVSMAVHAIDPIETSYFTNTAVSGYDPVAYFTQNAAVKGKKEFEYEWQDAVWRFSSEENKALFVESPEAYAPQFGGYCAYAVGLGKTAPGDPIQFSIVDEKLYLNYSSKTRVLWEDQRDQFIADGEENWVSLLAE